MDLVESVRLMAANELAVVDQWRGFVHHAESTVLPQHGGRLVKSLGDGIMAEFESPREGTAAALRLHQYFDSINAVSPPEQRLFMRAGLNVTHVYIDEHDIYGSGVNLAARVTSLAGPGETMATAALRDELADGLDAEIEDMGSCYLKHVAQPLRVYRVGPSSHQALLVPEIDYATPLQPTIAVIPFEARSNEAEYLSVGDLIAEAVIARLGQTAALRVISRFSALAFRGRGASNSELESRLGANYVLTGSYLPIGGRATGKLIVSVQLVDVKSDQLAWADRFQTDVADLLHADCETSDRIARAAHLAILNGEVQKARLQPLPTLAAYSLQLSGVSLMHRSTHREFQRSLEALGELLTRHRKLPDAHAWVAKWHVLNVIRGSSRAPATDAAIALDECDRALDIAPNHALAHAVKGYALAQLRDDGVAARECIDEAIALNPNEMHAWLYRSVWSTHWGLTHDAVAEAQQARNLSPLDPHAYFINTILSNAYAFDKQYDRAITTARRSLKQDRHHAPTLRALLLAQVESGRLAEARQTCAELLKLTPDLTVDAYKNMGNRESPARQRVIAAMRAVCVREH